MVGGGASAGRRRSCSARYNFSNAVDRAMPNFADTHAAADQNPSRAHSCDRSNSAKLASHAASPTSSRRRPSITTSAQPPNAPTPSSTSQTATAAPPAPRPTDALKHTATTRLGRRIPRELAPSAVASWRAFLDVAVEAGRSGGEPVDEGLLADAGQRRTQEIDHDAAGKREPEHEVGQRHQPRNPPSDAGRGIVRQSGVR